MSGTLWPALIAGQKARASDVEAKFDWLERDIVPMSGGAMTTGVYDLGTSTAAWRYLHMFPTGGVMCSGATSMAFLADGSVKLKNGTNINEFSTDGTFAGDSDLAVPTEKAVKAYVGTIAGNQLFEFRVDTLTASNSLLPYAYRQDLGLASTTILGLKQIFFNDLRIDNQSMATTTTLLGMYNQGYGVNVTSATFNVTYGVPKVAGYYEVSLDLLLQSVTADDYIMIVPRLYAGTNTTGWSLRDASDCAYLPLPAGTTRLVGSRIIHIANLTPTPDSMTTFYATNTNSAEYVSLGFFVASYNSQGFGAGWKIQKGSSMKIKLVAT